MKRQMQLIADKATGKPVPMFVHVRPSNSSPGRYRAHLLLPPAPGRDKPTQVADIRLEMN